MNMKVFCFVVLTAFILLSCAVVWAVDEAKIILVKGDPKIMKKGTSEWVSCKRDMNIDTGDRIKTSIGEQVGISYFEDSNIINMSEDSDAILVVSQASGSVDLLRGEAIVLAKKLPEGSTFEVKTPTGVSGARGTGWGSRTDGVSSQFSSYENSIYVKGIDRSGNVMPDELIVNEGFKTSLSAFERPEKIERLSSQEIDRWNNIRENINESIGQRGEAFNERAKPEIAAENIAGDMVKDESRERREMEDRSRREELKSERIDRIDSTARQNERIEGLLYDKQDISETRDQQRVIEGIEDRGKQPPPREENREPVLPRETIDR